MGKDAVLPLSTSLARIAAEYIKNRKVLGWDPSSFQPCLLEEGADLYGRRCGLPFGLGASPLLCGDKSLPLSYAMGARYFEIPLSLMLESQSGSVKASHTALKQHLEARVLCGVMSRLFGLDRPDATTEMAIYSLNMPACGQAACEGFLEFIRDGRAATCLEKVLDESEESLGAPDPFAGTDLEGRLSLCLDIRYRLCPPLFPVVSLSVPEGCRLEDVERRARQICDHYAMGVELKLGPWALGHERLADIYRRTGLEVAQASLRQSLDYRYAEIIGSVRKIFTLCRERSLFFGLKVDAALPTYAGKDREEQVRVKEAQVASWPENFAPAASLAARLAEDLSGTVPIGFSGGMDPERAALLARSGLRPLSVVSPLLGKDGLVALVPYAKAVSEALSKPGPFTHGSRNPLNRFREYVDTRGLREIASATFRPLA